MLVALVSQMLQDEFLKCPGPAGGACGSEYLDRPKGFESFDISFAQPPSRRFVLARKNKQEQIISLAEDVKSGNQGHSAAFVLKCRAKGHDHVRLRIGIGDVEHVEVADVIFVVGDPADHKTCALDHKAPSRRAAGQGRKRVGFSPTPIADQNKCFALLQCFAPLPKPPRYVAATKAGKGTPV